MKCLNQNQIKLIAIIAMSIDHIAWYLYPGYSLNPLALIMHMIGRITCIIMCYMVAQGYYHTKNLNKYILRLFVFALISHIPYVLTSINYIDYKSFIPFYYGEVLNQTSIMLSLTIGLIMLKIANSELNSYLKVLFIIVLCFIALPSDYSCIASLWIVVFGCNRNDFKKQFIFVSFYLIIYMIIYCLTIDLTYGLLHIFVLLAFPIINMYNGKRGSNPLLNKVMKWFFYLYYPIHLLILGLI